MIKNGIVDSIVSEMIRQAYETRIENAEKEIADMVRPVLWENVPDCIKEIYDNESLKEYLNLSRTYTIRIPNMSAYDIHIEGGYPEPARFKEIVTPELEEAVKNQRKLFDEKWKFRNQLVCAISNIPSIKKLKDEFPEAYDAYLIIADKLKSKPGCDTIEEVRAKLSKLSKEETCSQENQPREEQ